MLFSPNTSEDYGPVMYKRAKSVKLSTHAYKRNNLHILDHRSWHMYHKMHLRDQDIACRTHYGGHLLE